jgi:hypothetical protein
MRLGKVESSEKLRAWKNQRQEKLKSGKDILRRSP